jgi:hypothetical protein
VESNPGPKLLLLDSYSTHQMSSVFKALNELQTDVEIQPAGCTSACQPVDGGFNKPLKDHARTLHHEHQLASFEADGRIKTPSRQQVSH